MLSKYLVEEFEEEPAFVEQVQSFRGGVPRPVMAKKECYVGEQGKSKFYVSGPRAYPCASLTIPVNCSITANTSRWFSSSLRVDENWLSMAEAKGRLNHGETMTRTGASNGSIHVNTRILQYRYAESRQTSRQTSQHFVMGELTERFGAPA